jgi:CBS domain containing-hemolysin-like protein
MDVFLFVIVTLLRSFFALARSAFSNVRRARLLEMEQRGVTSAFEIQRLTENSSRLLATSEVGAVLGIVFAGGVATMQFVPVVQAQLVAWLPMLSVAFAQAVAFVIVMLAAAFVLFVLGRLVPEAVAVRHAERIALTLLRPMQLLSYAFSPLVRFAIIASNLLSIPFGGQKRESTQLVTEQEIKTMVDAGQEEGLIEQDEKAMILSVLDFGDTVAREVMVPRIDILALDVDTQWNETVDFIIKSGHSRVPVYKQSIDDIIGILYAKDVLKAMRDGVRPPIDKLVRKVYFTPESKRVNELLQELQKTRVHVSIVVDEYGGTAGLLTIEDILEEIVGEIQDEYDEEQPEYVPAPDGKGYIIEAGMLISDVNDLLNVQLPEDQSDTIGGFIYDQLGKVPVAGEVVNYNGLTAEVLAVSDRRILKVKVIYEPPQSTQQIEQAEQNEPSRAATEEDAGENARENQERKPRANGNPIPKAA